MNRAANFPPEPDPRSGWGGQPRTQWQQPPAGQQSPGGQWPQPGPQPQPGQQPPAAQFTPSPWGRVKFAAGVVTGVFVIGVLTGGVDLPRVAVFWVVMLPVILLPLLTTKSKRLSAEVGWLWQGGEDFVATRALVSVEASEQETNRTLKLVDSAGREVSARLDHLRGNPALWQLVHDDILRSAQFNGTAINGPARAVLGLDRPMGSR
ncbi:MULTISPECIES: hypothetical protein [unclassified Actinopolyspora]|uniref:hypothetical protein n=1 Tax=unclassified Actinopolyspora TaxID=2639451 RepID=UPI0013F5ACFB|nr:MULTISPECIES: hypothetical protein [unclassified Actinopolyspora]NHD18990.1 hypothetical protein [Actinopolyspora sp. BKK2]NHE78225.1 hypothetical protein [Actinopolyspora sp. BKK1]